MHYPELLPGLQQNLILPLMGACGDQHRAIAAQLFTQRLPRCNLCGIRLQIELDTAGHLDPFRRHTQRNKTIRIRLPLSGDQAQLLQHRTSQR